jgi:ATP-dependent Lhr-like helicase
VFSHATALTLHELSDAMPAKLDMTVPPGFQRMAATPEGLRLHRARLTARDVAIVRAIGTNRVLSSHQVWETVGGSKQKVLRRLEARGEIRGGHFVSGVSGEQFALPEAIGSLRSLRKTKPSGDLIMLSAADPLNLVGVLTPGPRITAIGANRLLLRDGVPIAALEAGQVINLNGDSGTSEREIEQSLKVGKLSPALRRYYR